MTARFPGRRRVPARLTSWLLLALAELGGLPVGPGLESQKVAMVAEKGRPLRMTAPAQVRGTLQTNPGAAPRPPDSFPCTVIARSVHLHSTPV